MATLLQKKKRKLVIGAKRGKWRNNGGAESSEQDFKLVRPKVLMRDANTCMYCGITMKKMHVHHENDNHSDNRMENLMTVDDLCHAVNHVGFLGKDGVVVFMPGVSQVNIVHLCRTIVVAISFGGEMGEKAKRLFDLLCSNYSAPMQEIFGSSSPADFGNALLAISDDDYNSRDVSLRDVRVIFKPDSLSDYATRACESSYVNLPVSSWERVYNDFEGKKNNGN